MARLLLFQLTAGRSGRCLRLAEEPGSHFRLVEVSVILAMQVDDHMFCFRSDLGCSQQYTAGGMQCCGCVGSRQVGTLEQLWVAGHAGY